MASKKIGILFGKERSFPEALISRINAKKNKGITAEAVLIDKVIQAKPSGYTVIIDRISNDVPFYRSYLKNAALMGTAVVNNPFWGSADEKFFNNALASKIGVTVPKTVILPSRELPDKTSHDSFSNLTYPFDWKSIFEYIGFPAIMKPFAGGVWNNTYKVESPEDFFEKHAGTGQLVMLLQEEIIFDQYYRCLCIGKKDIRIIPYEPRNPHHLRYVATFNPSKKALEKMTQIAAKINEYTGYEFNSIEFAIRDGVPYAINFCNPVPDEDLINIGEDNFEWLVESTANYAIELALNIRPKKDNLCWGKYITDSSQKIL
jgi:hypothetical protein